MNALITLFPVFFMLGLGFISKIKGWITPEQKAGANEIIFTILFPLLIFNILAPTKIEMEHVYIIIYVACSLCIAILIGKLTSSFTGKQYSHFSHYLFCCMEGGNVALPLYLSIVGSSSNTVMYDLGGCFIIFILMPIMIARTLSQGSSKSDIIKNVLKNPFVITVILALTLNLTGIYDMLLNSAIGPMITATLNQATSPIVAMILFILGYDLTIDKSILGPVLRLALVKTVVFAGIIAGFFVLFPTYMADPMYRIAPVIYFMCPTGFASIPIFAPLYRSEEDSRFTSAFLSMYMIVTLIVYVGVVVFMV